MRATALAASLSLAAYSPSLADKVELKVDATSFSLRGEIVQYDGLDYLFRSALGEVLIQASFVTCEGAFCPSRREPGAAFGIHGSNTIGASLLPALLRGYAESEGFRVERQPGENGISAEFSMIDDREQKLMATIDLRTEGSSTSFPSLLSSTAAIGMSSRKIRLAEVNRFVQAGFDPINAPGREHVVALDGLVIIVADENPIDSLSVENISRIFSGEVRNWREVGGPDAPINIYARDENSGTADTFEALVLEPRGLSLASNAIRYPTNDDVSDSVAGDAYGIGFTDFAHSHDAHALSLKTSCGLSVSPEPFSVKTEEYPLSRRLYLYTTGRTMPGKAAAILGFMVSDEAQPIVETVGFVSQSIAPGPFGEDIQRIKDAETSATSTLEKTLAHALTTELSQAARLSPTLHFDPVSGDLESKARGDIARVARFAAANLDASLELVLVGYSDREKELVEGLEEAVQRAELAADALRRNLNFLGAGQQVSVVPLGFGPIAPVACSDTEKGRLTNERVEIWIRDHL